LFIVLIWAFILGMIELAVWSAHRAPKILRTTLIPDGSDGDITRLSHELAARCPEARISLT
jgi:hypothetical protein